MKAMLSAPQKKKLIEILAEDIGKRDVTSALLEPVQAHSQIRANENCTLAGVEEAVFLFESAGCKAKPVLKDAQTAKAGQQILSAHGENKKLLSVERTALNVLGRMSAVATLCKKATSIANGRTKIFLTRKTMPGFNEFDKKAASCGGSLPHRLNLSEMILIKDNHLEFEGIESLLEKAHKAKNKTPAKKIEIEVENFKQAIEACNAGADIIMLDNFSLADAKKTIGEIRKKCPSALIEVSGGINLKNLNNYCKLRPDMLSMGELTKKAGMIDFSMDIKKESK